MWLQILKQKKKIKFEKLDNLFGEFNLVLENQVGFTWLKQGLVIIHLLSVKMDVPPPPLKLSTSSCP